jgi:YidC/Oxa1 family membrane protein insertase
MEKRALIALALSFVVFMSFIFLGEKLKKPSAPEAPPAKTEAAAPAAPEARPAPAPAVPAAKVPAAKASAASALPQGRPAREVVVDTPLYRAVFTEQGGRLQSFQLKKYREAMPFTPISAFKLGPVNLELERYQDPGNSGVNPKELVRAGKSTELPLGLSWEGKDLAVPALLNYEASKTNLTLSPGDKGTVQFTGVSPEGVTFTKTFTFKSDSYSFDLAVKVANRTSRALEGSLSLELSEDFAGEEASRFNFLGFNSSINNHQEEIKSGSVKEFKTFAGKVDWVGLDEGYFLTAMVPLRAPKGLITLKETPGTPMVATLKTPVEGLAPGQETQFSYALYFGPKDLDDLKPLNLGLERTVNFGWFDVLGKPLLYTLKFFDRYTHNYGWSIILLTFLIRVLFFYPNHKSYKSMKEMQKLQPKVAKLREKFKDDKEAMNKELMALYRTFKVNPIGGCLPMVIQLPVFIALYNVLGYAIELRHASFISTLPFTDYVWLADLATKDPLLITPIIMGASMFIQQKMTPSPGDPTQAKMMMFLPLVFTFMFLNFASGLVLYWLVNNILSIIQQHYTNKYLT